MMEASRPRSISLRYRRVSFCIGTGWQGAAPQILGGAIRQQAPPTIEALFAYRVLPSALCHCFL